MGIVYLNGEFMPADEACVPVLDRGFLFGDGVYEVIPAYGRKLFRLPHHLQRLDNSLRATRIPNPMTTEQWTGVLNKLLAANAGEDQSLYLQVTRGVAARDHAFPRECVPTVFAMVNPLQPPAAEVLANGVAAITREDIRWRRCDIKAITLLANILLRQDAADHHAYEAILVRDGYVTEGAASNVFIVRDGILITPPADTALLPGITRNLVMEIAEQHGIETMERRIAEAELRQCDELWVTSSTKEILPITRLDGAPVGAGVPGPLWQRLRALYQDYKAALRSGAA